MFSFTLSFLVFHIFSLKKTPKETNQTLPMQVFHMSFLLVRIPMGEVSGFVTGLTGSVNPQIKGQFSFKKYYRDNFIYMLIKL